MATQILVETEITPENEKAFLALIPERRVQWLRAGASGFHFYRIRGDGVEGYKWLGVLEFASEEAMAAAQAAHDADPEARASQEKEIPLMASVRVLTAEEIAVA